LASRDFFDQDILGAIDDGPGIHFFGNTCGLVTALAGAGGIYGFDRKYDGELGHKHEFVVAKRFEAAEVRFVAQKLT
jgi:hypothetical protein